MDRSSKNSTGNFIWSSGIDAGSLTPRKHRRTGASPQLAVIAWRAGLSDYGAPVRAARCTAQAASELVRQRRPPLAASCLHSARGRIGIMVRVDRPPLVAACVVPPGDFLHSARAWYAVPDPFWKSKGSRMHLLDVTMLHGPAVGGVSRYLSTKRRWIRDNTRVRHSQLVAAPAAGRGTDGEFLLPGIRLPLCGPLHWPLDAARWIDTIGALAPDVIEANDVGSAAWFALAAARKMDVPLLGFAHVDLVRFARERKGALAERVVIGYMRAYYNRCAVVIAPSEYMRARLASWGVDRVVVRHLGVDAAQFNPRSRSSKLGAPYHLLLVGGGEAPALPRNVTRLPFVANTGVLARLIASADALVHAGDVETFGLVYLEAMACGRPVVAAAGGAAAEIVDGGCGVLARPASASSLAEGIAALYERDLDALGAKARARVEAQFTLDLSMHRLLALYRTAVAAPLSTVPALVAT